MASLRNEFGDTVTYRYHEFNAPDSAQVVRDFQIQMHPETFILDRQGHLVRKFEGYTTIDALRSVLRPLVPSSTSPRPVSQLAAEAVPAYTQHDQGEGGVEIAVTYVTSDYLKSGGGDAQRYEPDKYAVFLVSMNTHSVDLSGYDMVKISELRTGGTPRRAIRWVSTSEDSHHRAGALIFPKVGSSVTVELIITTIAGVPARTFRWAP